MKKFFAVFITGLSLCAFAACGSSSDADPYIDDTSYEDESVTDYSEDSGEDPDETHSGPVSFVHSDEELAELVGTWNFTGLMNYYLTFYPDGSYHYYVDYINYVEDGTYQFNGVDILLCFELDGEKQETYLELSDGYLCADYTGADGFEKISDDPEIHDGT